MSYPKGNTCVMSESTKLSTMSDGTKPSTMSEGTKPSSMSEGTKPSFMSACTKHVTMSEGTKPSFMSEGTKPSSMSACTKHVIMSAGTKPVQKPLGSSVSSTDAIMSEMAAVFSKLSRQARPRLNIRGKRRTNNRAVVQKTTNNTKMRLNGASLKIRPDPTATVDRPWNSAVLSFNLTTPGNLNVAIVNTSFQNQIGTTTNPPAVLYRFQQLRAWETSGGNLGASILDFNLGGDQDAIRTQHDEPGRNHWACCALMWPNTQQNDAVLSTNTTRNLAILSTSAATTTITIHLHILWRFVGNPAPSREATISTVGFLKTPVEQIVDPTVDDDDS